MIGRQKSIESATKINNVLEEKMLDLSLYGAYQGMIFSDSAYRCRRCGQGPVMGSDGFLMSHCMNCGNWQGAAEPINLGFGWMKEKLFNLFRNLKKCFFNAAIESPSVPVLAAGGGGQ